MMPFDGPHNLGPLPKTKLKSTTSNPIPNSSCTTTFTFDNVPVAATYQRLLDDTSPEVELRTSERNFPLLDLSAPNNNDAPVLIIQSPKTPTLCRKLKAVSLDSDPQPTQSHTSLEVSRRDVFSMPNTPKKQLRCRSNIVSFDDTGQRFSLATPPTTSNLKHFSSNSSISGSQTLKTLPEIMMLQDFDDANQKNEPIRIKSKGLLERRGSNASLTIDLGLSGETTPTVKAAPAALTQFHRLNNAKSVSNLNLSQYESPARCACTKTSITTSNSSSSRSNLQNIKESDKRKSQTHLETCGNCTIYESIASKSSSCKIKTPRKCGCICNYKCRRKSLSNENLYVPPCSVCQVVSSTNSGTTTSGSSKCCGVSTPTHHHQCKGHRMACYPRQADLDASQMLSEDFKMHLQNIQYLQTAGSVLAIADLKSFRKCQLHQEFWEVPLNLQEKCLVSGSQTRNRYKGVIPNEQTRVHLPGPQSYIQANYIKGPDYSETNYIATQGPMHHTCRDFWEMVWANKTNCIVMLTQLVEKGFNKCELYFPLGRTNPSRDPSEKSLYIVRTTKARDKFSFDIRNTNQNHQTISTTKLDEQLVEFEELDHISYGPFTVRHLTHEDLVQDCTLRHLELTRSDTPGVKRQICHYWFTNWQDHKMANAEQVLTIGLHVLDLLDRTKTAGTLTNPILHRKKRCNPPPNTPITQGAPSGSSNGDVDVTPLPVVHCSAGIGRTGCFLAILNGIQQLRGNYNVDVLATLCSLRLNRGGMVQTAEQYELVHKVLSLYADTLTVK